MTRRPRQQVHPEEAHAAMARVFGVDVDADGRAALGRVFGTEA